MAGFTVTAMTVVAHVAVGAVGLVAGAVLFAESTGEGADGNLPENPDGLLEQGYEEVSHPEAAKKGHRTFVNPHTGDEVRFDKGEQGKSGFKGEDHYHRPNPAATSKHNEYLDKNGNPCARGSCESHLFPGK